MMPFSELPFQNIFKRSHDGSPHRIRPLDLPGMLSCSGTAAPAESYAGAV